MMLHEQETYTVLNTNSYKSVIVRVNQLGEILSTIAHAITTAVDVKQHR